MANLTTSLCLRDPRSGSTSSKNARRSGRDSLSGQSLCVDLSPASALMQQGALHLREEILSAGLSPDLQGQRAKHTNRLCSARPAAQDPQDGCQLRTTTSSYRGTARNQHRAVQGGGAALEAPDLWVIVRWCGCGVAAGTSVSASRFCPRLFDLISTTPNAGRFP